MDSPKVAKNVTIVHFLLMFGYKMFSLYFPLFLVARHFSIPQVGYAMFFIYLPIALFAPLVGFLNHKIHSGLLAAFGVLGYGLYSLGMLLFTNLVVFYLLQIMLGLSAALFFVSMRTLLMRAKLKSPDGAFAWFYTAPSYADALAPAIGALIIWKFGFAGVFIASLGIHLLTAIFCFITLKKNQSHVPEKISIKESSKNYRHVFEGIKQKKIYSYILISFFILLLAGFNNAFFVLFLKSLGWTQNNILVFNSILSLVFLPVSFWFIKIIAKAKSQRNVSLGSQIAGVFYVALGALAGVLNFYVAFFIMLGNSIGGLMTGSGRSGLMATKLKQYAEESAAVDTMFSPFATAIGSLAGGFLIVAFGYPLIFIFSGVLIFGAGLVVKKNTK